MKKPRSKAIDHYSPARRLHQLKTMLNASGGLTIYEIAERLGTSVRDRDSLHACARKG